MLTNYLLLVKATKKWIVFYITILAFIIIIQWIFTPFEQAYFILLSAVTSIQLLIHPLLTSYSIQLYALLVSVVSGVYGFIVNPYQEYSFTNALYSTGRLLTFDVDPVFDKAASKFVEYPVSIEIARWAAAVYIISTILQIVFHYFGHSLKRKKITLLGKHYIFIGMNPKSKLLAQDLIEKKRAVLLIVEEEDTDVKELREIGAVVVKGDLLHKDTFKKAAMHKSKALIAISSEDTFTLNLVRTVAGYTKKFMIEEQIPFYVQHNQLLTQNLFDRMGKQVEAGHLELSPVSLHSLIGRRLLEEHPLYIGYEKQALKPEGNPFHLLFIGFGMTGEQIAIQALQRAHFLNKSKLHITILDKEAERTKRYFFDSFPRLADIAVMHFVQADIETVDITDLISRQETAVTHIYTCLAEDEANVVQGIRICQRYKDLPVFVKIQHYHELAEWLDKESAFPNLRRFGSWENVMTEELIIHQRIDAAAKRVHENYAAVVIEELKKSGKSQEIDQKIAEQRWERQPFFIKNSNRAQVDHLETKAFLLGLRITDMQSDAAALDSEAYAKHILPHLEALAQVEHRRWNAFHIMNGWDTLPLHAITDKQKDADRKLHACLVSWEELPAVSEKLDTDYQEKDRNTIRELMGTLNIEEKKLTRNEERTTWKPTA